MIRTLFVFFIFVVSLSALSDMALLKRADSFLHSNSKSDQFRAYNDYKMLYLRAFMSKNKNLRINSLNGIINSGKRLHIDIYKYSKELFETKSKIKQKIYHKKIIKITSSHKLKEVRWRNNRLLLKFDKKLKNNQINYFSFYDKNTKRYKYVFDIHASMLTRSQSLRKNGIDKIKLAQLNQDTLRLVIANRYKVSIRFKKDSKNLVIKMLPNKIIKRHTKILKYTSKNIISKNKIIVIDAGHGGKDPGAIGYRHYKEKIIVLQIADELKKYLKSRGYKVYMTRDSDKFIKLRSRTKYANKKKADLFISIHANAVGRKIAKQVYGIECYFLDKSRSSRAKSVAAQENSADMTEMDFYGKESFLNTLNSHNIVAANKLAIDLQRGSLATLRKKYKNVKDAGVRPAPFWVLVGAQMPAVLVEVGFITNPTEATMLIKHNYQKMLALGLANGVERYFLNN